MLEQAAILRQGGHLNELWCRVVVMSVIGGHLISEFSTRNALSPYPLSQNMPTPTKAVARLQGRAGAANLEDLDQVIANYLLVALTRIAHSLDTGTRPRPTHRVCPLYRHHPPHRRGQRIPPDRRKLDTMTPETDRCRWPWWDQLPGGPSASIR